MQEKLLNALSTFEEKAPKLVQKWYFKHLQTPLQLQILKVPKEMKKTFVNADSKNFECDD